MKIKVLFVILAILLSGCVVPIPEATSISHSAKNIPNCNYNNYSGKEIVFNKMSGVLSKYGYGNFSTNYQSSIAKGATYQNYNSRKAKVSESLLYGWATTKWYRVLVDNCDVLYLTAKFAGNIKSVEEMQKYADFSMVSVFLENKERFEKYLKLEGKTVWVGNGKGLYKSLVSSADKLIYVGSNEDVKVIGVKNIENMPPLGNILSAPFYLYVERKNGDKGYYPYEKSVVKDISPFPKSWNPKIVQLIKNRSVVVGMSEDQTKMAWGLPNKINTSIDRYSVSDQWVYGIGEYLYFKNGRLDAIQSSK